MKKHKNLKKVLSRSWDPNQGDYVREHYEYDKSHEEILKKEKRVKKIANIFFFVFAIVAIVVILQLMTSV